MLISLKFLSPTNHRGSRIKATCNQLTKTYHWDYSLEVSDNYRKAAMQLVLDLRKINPEVLPPCSARVFLLKDQFYALTDDCNA